MSRLASRIFYYSSFSILLLLNFSCIDPYKYTGPYTPIKDEEMLRLSFQSNPDGAKIYLNDSLIGTTPFSTSHSGLWNCRLIIIKEGYRTVHERINITKSEDFNFVLERKTKAATNYNIKKSEAVRQSNKSRKAPPANANRLKNRRITKGDEDFVELIIALKAASSKGTPLQRTDEDITKFTADKLKPKIYFSDSKLALLVDSLLEAKRFAVLSWIADTLLNEKVRYDKGYGSWLLTDYYLALGEFRSSDDYELKEALLIEWSKTLPDSEAPRIALASLYMKSAWKARGRRWAKTITESGKNAFEQELLKAEKALQFEYNYSDPHACVLQLQLTLLLSNYKTNLAADEIGIKDTASFTRFEDTFRKGRKAEAYRILEEGFKREPDYYYLYEEFARFLLERWYGQKGEWQKFAKNYSEKRGGVAGSVIYTRILNKIRRYYYAHDFFNETGLEWKKAQPHFEKVLVDRPNSGLDLNRYAFFAFIAGDFETANKLTSRILEEKKHYPSIWSQYLFKFRGAEL